MSYGMDLILAALIFLILIGILIGIFVYLRKFEKIQLVNRALGYRLYEVLIFKTKEEGKTNEDVLLNDSQFFNSLAGFKKPLVFELAVANIEEEIKFYAAVHRSEAEALEKQINSFYLKSEIVPIEDYNIFNPNGVALASELKLANPFILPIKTFRELKTDPLGSLVGIFNKLQKKGEGMAFQLIIKKAPKTAKDRIFKAVSELRKGKKLKEILYGKGAIGVIKEARETISPPKKAETKPYEFPQKETREDLVQIINAKAGSNLFSVNLRIIVSAGDKNRAEELLSQIKNYFEQFSKAEMNSFKSDDSRGKSLDIAIYNFSFRNFRTKSNFILNSEELATVYHFPSFLTDIPKIHWLKARASAPPTDIPQEGIILGTNHFRGETSSIRILDSDRARHLYLVGQTGTGKSTMISNLIKQDIENGQGVALIDPHGDLAEKILGLVPKNRINDVVYFNPSDIERPMALNMLEYDRRYPEQKTFIINEMIEIFDKLYDLRQTGGPIFEQYMRNSMLLVMDDPEELATLIEIPRVLSNPDYRREKLSRTPNPLVREFWEKEAEKAGGEAALANLVPYITSKLNPFISNDFVRPIIAQYSSALNFREIMDNGKILIVNLSKGRLGDMNSFLLGMIVVSKLVMAAFSRSDIPEEQRRPFYLYIDEFQNVTTKTISTIFSEARKYQLSLVVAHQFIAQLKEEIRDSVFGNVGSIVSFRIGSQDAEFLEKQLAPVFSAQDLLNLENYNAYVKLLIRGFPSPAFNIKIQEPPIANVELARDIKESSRQKYGKPREEVEKEILKRFNY